MVYLHLLIILTPRFDTKVNTIDSQLRKDNKEDIKFKFRLNEDFVFPIE